jgi:hypothetical protein
VAYSADVKRFIIALSLTRSAEKVVDLVYRQKDERLLELSKSLNAPINSMDVRDLRVSKLSPKTVRMWLKREKVNPLSKSAHDENFPLVREETTSPLEIPSLKNCTQLNDMVTPQSIKKTQEGSCSGFNESSHMFRKELKAHFNDLRKLANRIMGEIRLPDLEILYVNMTSNHGTFRQENGPIGIYRRMPILKKGITAFYYNVSTDGTVRLLCPSELDAPNNDLFHYLQDHLSDFPPASEIWERRRLTGGDILVQWHKLVTKVEEEIKKSKRWGRKMTGDEMVMTDKDFAITVCINAINIVRGFWPPMDPVDSEMRSIGSIFGYMAKGLLPYNPKRYEKYHRELTEEYSQFSDTKKIGELMNDLERLDNRLLILLNKFVRAIRVPGYCDVCKNAF